MALELGDSPPVSAFEKAGEIVYNKLDKLVKDGCIYQHQADAVKAIKEELDHPPEGHGEFRNVSLAVLPTGTGKTGVGVLAAYVCRAHRVLVVTPSETISKQQMTQFKPEKDETINPLGADPFILQRGIFKQEKEDTWAPFNSVCVLKKKELKAALNNKRELVITNAHKFGDESGKGLDITTFPQDYFSLVIVDEAHHYPAKTWKNIVERFKQTKILFLTATPYNKGKYILEGKKECYEFSRKKAIEQGIIRDTEFIECSHVGQVNTLTPQVNRIEEIRQVLDEVHKCLQYHDSQDPRPSARHKAMILANGIEEAELIAQLWTNAYNQFGECKTFVQNDLIENVKEFEKPESNTRVLVVIFRLTEGFDCKNVSVAAILRNVAPSSRVYFAQFVGRAVRKLHPDDPVKATVISHRVHNQRANYDTFEKLAEEDPKEDDEYQLPQVSQGIGNDLEELPQV